MNIIIQNINFTASDELKDLVKSKLSKLEQFHDKIIAVDVYLKKINTNDKEDKQIEVTVSLPGDDIVIKKKATAFEEGIDIAMDSLKKSIKRKKDKLRSV